MSTETSKREKPTKFKGVEFLFNKDDLESQSEPLFRGQVTAARGFFPSFFHPFTSTEDVAYNAAARKAITGGYSTKPKEELQVLVTHQEELLFPENHPDHMPGDYFMAQFEVYRKE
jgi:hypothetical protein